jgi:glucan phosphoethanolaminetransferase (alkaline phosphatase superfamily)
MMGYAHMGGVGFLLMKLFCLLFVLGVILFLVWAVRMLDKKQLKKWVIGLLVVGILGMVGSSLFMGKWDKWDKEDGDWMEGKLEFCKDLEEKLEAETP